MTIDTMAVWAVMAIVILVSVWTGFRMGRMVSGCDTHSFLPVSIKRSKPFNDDAGGAFEDHVPGGIIEQEMDAEAQERIKTL